MHGLENTQCEILRGVHPEPSEILRCAQNDSEGLRMTVGLCFSRATKARRYNELTRAAKVNVFSLRNTRGRAESGATRQLTVKMADFRVCVASLGPLLLGQPFFWRAPRYSSVVSTK